VSAGTAIGMVSESLAELIEHEMALRPEVKATILSPDEPSSERRVNLFLYRIAENPFLRNLDWQLRPGSPNLVPPPLSLTLYYLVTAYAPNDARTGNSSAQEILGEAMRVLYENPVIPERHLVTGLKSAVEEIRVVHISLDMDEVSRIWGTFDQPYRTSTCYEVSVVQLDMLAAGGGVPARVRAIGVPDTDAPFRPPVVTAMDPTHGRPGDRVVFTGEHLAGWRADVRVTGHMILAGLELERDSFPATLPNDLKPGLHQLQVDVSGLFRRVFLFEVVA
jgi:hypothetical protein